MGPDHLQEDCLGTKIGFGVAKKVEKENVGKKVEEKP